MHIPKQESRGHIQNTRVYFIVGFVLLVLTAITVLASYVDWGEKIGGGFVLNVSIAMFIASTKAYFVIMYFMHVKYEKKVIWLFGLAYPIFLFALLLFFISIDIFLRVMPEPTQQTELFSKPSSSSYISNL